MLVSRGASSEWPYPQDFYHKTETEKKKMLDEKKVIKLKNLPNMR